MLPLKLSKPKISMQPPPESITIHTSPLFVLGLKEFPGETVAVGVPTPLALMYQTPIFAELSLVNA